MTDSVSKTPETAATPAETAAAAAAEGAGASSQMTDTPQPAQADTLSPTAIAPVSAVTAPPAEPHELVLIDYQEATLHSLEDFCKLQGSARVQKEDLDAMVLNISKTGQVWFVAFSLRSFHLLFTFFARSLSYPWDLVKLYLAFRLEIVCAEHRHVRGCRNKEGFTFFFGVDRFSTNSTRRRASSRTTRTTRTSLVTTISLHSFLISLRLLLLTFSKENIEFYHPPLFFSLCRAPFTIQRLCEVIVRPEHYTQTNALLFGLEKMVSVSTVQKTLTPAEVERVNATLTAAHQAVAAVPERPTVPTKDTVIDVPARPAEDPETKMV